MQESSADWRSCSAMVRGATARPQGDPARHRSLEQLLEEFSRLNPAPRDPECQIAVMHSAQSDGVPSASLPTRIRVAASGTRPATQKKNNRGVDVPNQEKARQAAEALLAQARTELALKKKARLERACRRLRRWKSPLIPALSAAIATWALTVVVTEPWLAIAFGVTAGYLYSWLGRRSAQDAVRRLQKR